jgi:hypothetical protein
MELCEITVEQDGLALRDMPQELRIIELFKITVEQKWICTKIFDK